MLANYKNYSYLTYLPNIVILNSSVFFIQFIRYGKCRFDKRLKFRFIFEITLDASVSRILCDCNIIPTMLCNSNSENGLLFIFGYQDKMRRWVTRSTRHSFLRFPTKFETLHVEWRKSMLRFVYYGINQIL